MLNTPNALAVTVRDNSDRLHPYFTFTCDRVSTRTEANGGGFTLVLTCDESATVWDAALQESGEGSGRAADLKSGHEQVVAWAVDHPGSDGTQILPFSAAWSLIDVRPNPLLG